MTDPIERSRPHRAPFARSSRRLLIRYVTTAALLVAIGAAIYRAMRSTDRDPLSNDPTLVVQTAVAPVVARLEEVQGKRSSWRAT